MCSLYTGLTNNDGVASVTVTNVTGTLTYTCSYSNVSDTCTVTGTTYLFYDECTSADGLSNYGQIIAISSSTTTSQLEYNSSNNAYYVHANGDWGLIPITVLNGKDNFKITGEFKTKASSTTNQGGFIFRSQNTTDNIVFRKYSTYCNSLINLSNQSNIGTVRASQTYWHKFEITKQGKEFTCTVTDLGNDEVVGTQTRTVTFDTYYCGFVTVGGSSYGSYVRNVKAEAL